jgi:hypothetical protein
MSLYHRFKDRFGTAGVVLGVIAIVLAIGGSAIAASGLNGKQKKEVKAIAKSFQGTGPQGAAGAAGTNGTNGKDGTNGTNGTPGAPGSPGTDGNSVVLLNEEPPACFQEEGFTYEIEGSGVENEVCNGQPGENGEDGEDGQPWVVGQAPSGAVLKGTWTLNATATAANEPIPIPISFGVPAEAHEGGDIVPADGTDLFGEELFGEEVCNGTFPNPTPAAGAPVSSGGVGPVPGLICLYLNSTATNLKPWILANLDSVSSLPTAGGTIVRPKANSSGPVAALGSWAVTAE